MKHNRTLMICATLLLVGLVNAWILNKELEKFNRSFDFKNFTSSSSSPQIPPTVSVIGPNRFVVVEGENIGVYSTDASGKLKRTDNVNTSYSELQVRMRPDPNPNYPPR